MASFLVDGYLKVFFCPLMMTVFRLLKKSQWPPFDWDIQAGVKVFYYGTKALPGNNDN